MDYLTNFFQNVQLCYLLASAMKGKLNSKKKEIQFVKYHRICFIVFVAKTKIIQL